jgi:hypothetical protein
MRDHKVRRWEPQELRKALDTYLDGHGMAKAAEDCARGLEAVRNMIRSDMPRNYRGCVYWLPAGLVEFARAGRPWLIVEERYLMKLIRRRRQAKEMVIILARPWHEIEAKIEENRPDRGEGFFKEI